MSLNQLQENNQIEKFYFSKEEVVDRFSKAVRVFNFAVKNMKGEGDGDYDIIYSNIYDSIRLACETILWHAGFRVKKNSEGFHFITINAASYILINLENEFRRLQKMRKKRNLFDYGNLSSISGTELKQAVLDAKKLLLAVKKKISK